MLFMNHHNQSPCPPGTTSYIIRSGDTFYSLANRFNTTVQAIMAANPGVDPNRLMIGQQICIPTGGQTPSTCPPGTMPYIIRSGDNFYNLAIRYHTTVEAIMAANPGVDPNRLMIGQQICIPTGGRPPTCPPGTTSYTIKAGDTFYAIAQAHNITMEALMAANPGVNPDRLYIGQIICIPGSTPPPPTSKCPVLRIGSRGEDVIRLQRLLRNAGFDPGTIDGIFGSRTQAAVIAFQKSKNLVADGIVGIQTWTALGVNCGTGPTPPPSGCPSGTRPYTIKSGDTFFTLANRFNTTVEAIQRANPNVNPNQLQIGQVICIPVS